jgi:regulator of protease activity HflC (stomatin/prohibitin superfamily)
MKIVVNEWERVLVYRDGRLTADLGPGRHRSTWRRRKRVRVSVRPRLVVTPVQEVLTQDGLSVKVSLTMLLRVVDARTWHEAFENPEDVVYAAVQVALRDELAVRTLDSVVADRTEVPEAMRVAVASAAAQAGFVVDGLALRDIIVPTEIRRAAAAVVTARSEGQAALERARSEVAATRALANAAKLVETHPGLLQLRTLQAVEAGGATVVLSADPGATAAGRATV